MNIQTNRKEEILLKINSIKNFLFWNEKQNKPLYYLCIDLENKLNEVLK